MAPRADVRAGGGNGFFNTALPHQPARHTGMCDEEGSLLAMSITRRSLAASTAAFTAVVSVMASAPARADDREQLVENARHSLHQLEESDPGASSYAHRATGVLVFPSVLKAGFVFGGETGNGVLFVDGQPAGFYNLSGGSWGLQIGGQDFAYALFFMNGHALHYLKASQGWSVGTGPSIVVINKGAAGEANSTTVSQDVYAFPFNNKGLMADLTLQGSKITRIHPH
jgi:lipid-binding SYLF domain-containing protein